MPSLRESIPFGFILPFLLIIGFEYLIGFGLDYYHQKIQDQIATLESSLKVREESLQKEINDNEAYQVFSQFVNVIDLVKNRKSVYFVFQKFTPLIPKFVEIKKVEFDTDKNEIVLAGLVSNWLDYIRLHHYFSLQSDLIFKNFKSPHVDEENKKIEFEFLLQLKPSFYQQ